MADEVASLAIRIDTTGAEAAKAGLASVEKQAAATQLQTDKLTDSFVKQRAVPPVPASAINSTFQVGQAAEKSADAFGKYSNSSDKLLASLQRQVDVSGKSRAEIAARDAAVRGLTKQEQAAAIALGGSIDKYAAEEAAAKALSRQQDVSAASVANLVRRLEEKAAAVGKSAAASQVELLATKGASASQIQQAAAAAATIDAYKKTQSEASKAAHAVDGFSLSNSVAKRELITMGREISAGNYTRLSSSFSLFAQSSGLLALALTPIGLLITGVTIASAAMFAVFAGGQNEQKKLQNALLLTNNAAGLTEDGVHSLAESIKDGLSGTTIRTAQQTLEGLVASGKLTGEALSSAGKASLAFQQATGESTEKANAFFLGATNDVTRFATTTNQQYHYLTAAQLEYVKTLQETGHEQEALKLVFDAFAGTASKAAENIGSIERAWNAAKKAVSGYIDATLSLGKTPTTGKALEDAEKTLAKLQEIKRRQNDPVLAYSNDGTPPVTDADLTRAKDEVDNLRDVKFQEGEIAKAKGEQVAKDTARIGLDKLHDQFLTRQVLQEREIANAKARALIADPSGTDTGVQKTLNETIAGIKERYKTHGAITTEDLIKIDVDKIKAQFKVIEDGIKNSQQIAAAYHSAGLTDDATYYSQEVAYAQASAAKQVEALGLENAALSKRGANQKQNAENAKQVVINNGQIDDINTKSATQIALLTISYQKYLANIVVGYHLARAAAQEFLDQQEKQQKRSIEALGQSDRTNQFNSGRDQINDRYDREKKYIADEQAAIVASGREITGEERSAYALRLATLEEFHTKSLTSYTEYYANLVLAQNDWSNGAHRALQNYIDEAGFTARNTEQVFSNAFHGMEDSLTKFITTGKGGFKSLIDSFVADIIRLMVQQELVKPIAQYLQGSITGGGSASTGDWISKGVGLIGGLFGAGSGNLTPDATGIGIDPDSLRAAAGLTGGRAIGGPVSAGGMYRVNEKQDQPELLNVAGKQYLMPGVNGVVTPQSSGSGGGTQMVVHQNFTISQPASKQTQVQLAAAAAQGLRQGQRNL